MPSKARSSAKGVSPAPARVAILGMGPSLAMYYELTKGLGGRHALFDETWTINGLGDVAACDRIFHMDDVRVQEIRAAAQPRSNIAAMLAWMRTHPGPIYTSVPHPDYPGLVAYPLEAVLDDLQEPYFNSTVAYALAFAIHIGVKAIGLYGVDFTYPNSHHAERGRACVEFWLGVAMSRGIELSIAETSSLTDMCEGRPLYGFGAMGSADVKIRHRRDGRVKVTLVPRAALASAAEIEAAYDHSKHPSPHLVK